MIGPIVVKVLSLPLREPPLHVAVMRGGVVLVHDFLVLGVAVVAPALLERSSSLFLRLACKGFVLVAHRLERLHGLTRGRCKLELVAEVEERVNPLAIGVLPD